SMALLASLALPWVRWTCGAPGIPATLEELRFCATEAAAQPPYLVDYLGPLGSQLRGLPLGTALAAQFVSFGPAALCLLAALPALVALRSASWQRMGVSLGVVGGLSGVVSAVLLPLVFPLKVSPRNFIAHLGVGYHVAVTGFALTLLGAVLLRRRAAAPTGGRTGAPAPRPPTRGGPPRPPRFLCRRAPSGSP